MNKVLCVAYDFPPSCSSSGHIRTLAFCRHLPEFGWKPFVLTANRRAYPRIDEKSMASIPKEVAVRRAFALDAKNVFGYRGSYPVWMAAPDRWWTWWFGGVLAGLAMVRRVKPDVIWSTYPIATAHMIALTLHKMTGLPWVADFRDPVAVSTLNSKVTDRSRSWVERKTITNCSAAVFTTSGAQALYRQRFPEKPVSAWRVIPNGYDEAEFSGIEHLTPEALAGRPIRLVHSGVLYRQHRDPTPLFAAIKELRRSGKWQVGDVEIVLRASGDETRYAGIIEQMGVGDFVRLAPAIAYQEALAEQKRADGLLLFQGRGYNRQIPAKVYEYFRTQRPLLALVDPEGDTAHLLSSVGIRTVAPIDDSGQIMLALENLVDMIRSERPYTGPSGDVLASYSRRHGAARLAKLFESHI